jgi:enamine deaminase RidA (YjgF/YER057c/UK114 family)
MSSAFPSGVQRVPSASPYAGAIGFSAAVRAGDLVLLAGVSAVSADGEVVGGDDPYLQARECFRKIAETLAAAGAGLADVIHCRLYLASAEHWQEVGQAHAEAFAATRPAATMIVAGLLDPRMLVEIEVSALSSARTGRA